MELLKLLVSNYFIDVAVISWFSAQLIKTLLFYLQNGILQIEIENSFCGKMVRKREIFFTTKPDKAAHGIGLNNVRKIVEKYGGRQNG